MEKQTAEDAMHVQHSAHALPYPHFAQVPVVIVALVLLCDLPAQDDAVLPALRANEHS